MTGQEADTCVVSTLGSVYDVYYADVYTLSQKNVRLGIVHIFAK